MLKKVDFQKWAAIFICVCALVFLLRFLALPLLSATLPFLFAAGLVSLLSPVAAKLENRLHWNSKISMVVLFFLFICASLLFSGFLIAVILKEGSALVSGWLSDLGTPSSLISNAIDALHLPPGEESDLFRAQLKTMLTDFAK